MYYASIDAHVIALDASTGIVRWDVTMADYKTGHSSTGAPLAVRDKIITGVAGGEYGVRGFIDAYDAKTGKRVWRFWTIPEPGEPGNDTWEGNSWKTGSATTWVTGVYDPNTNTVYWGTGNPGPDWNGDVRKGDNLYSDSLLALDADTGRKKWHFQYTPHDEHDWDSTQTPALVDTTVNGQAAEAGRAGEPQRLLLLNRPGHWPIPCRTALCEADLGERSRRGRPPNAAAEHDALGLKELWYGPALEVDRTGTAPHIARPRISTT